MKFLIKCLIAVCFSLVTRSVFAVTCVAECLVEGNDVLFTWHILDPDADIQKYRCADSHSSVSVCPQRQGSQVGRACTRWVKDILDLNALEPERWQAIKKIKDTCETYRQDRLGDDGCESLEYRNVILKNIECQ